MRALTALELVLQVAAVALLVYGITDSRLARGFRVRLYRWAYRRAGADFNDGSWALDDDSAAPLNYGDSAADHRWDEFVHADDDPPLHAVLVTCHWCTGLYASLLVGLVWKLDRSGWHVWTDLFLSLGMVAAGVVGAVVVLAVIARLGR